ncbi:MAG: hypothetical protein E7655_04920 [Ruminococcaceae bacterium]|nr:hypothetical protein [Oscillospiraceae bacterium]
MTHEDFALIEKELDIVLPERYKKLALEAPLKDTAYSNAFYDDPRKLIRTNLRLRKNGIYGSEPLWKNHLVVGFYFDQYAYIDVSSEEDVHYKADRTKGFHYTPTDKEYNSLRFDLFGYIDIFLFYHERDLKRQNTPPEQLYKRPSNEKVCSFLLALQADHQKMKEEQKKQEQKNQE